MREITYGLAMAEGMMEALETLRAHPVLA